LHWEAQYGILIARAINKKESELPKYEGYSRRDVDLDLMRRDQRNLGTRDTNVGPDYSFDDQAILLSLAIEAVDRKLKKAFTPEAAEKAYKKANK
jgi:hypothetical protein